MPATIYVDFGRVGLQHAVNTSLRQPTSSGLDNRQIWSQRDNSEQESYVGASYCCCSNHLYTVLTQDS